MSRVLDLLTDLEAESATLDAMVELLDDTGWSTPTPAPGWTVAHQIAHLAWTDGIAILALTNPAEFAAALQAQGDPLGSVDSAAAHGAGLPSVQLLDRWRRGRKELTVALSIMDPDVPIQWLGPPMKPASMVTARLMECWAHGQDVADALGAQREPSHRLRHIAHLAVRAMPFAFAVRELPVPQTPVRVELDAPDGACWTWGPPDAADRVSGPALDFCLLTTQRRHRCDLAMTASGATADTWLDVAQAFAGPAGPGRQPGQFR